MPKSISLNLKIDHTKELLEQTVKERFYNFIDPEVIALSQKLDRLIIQSMKEKEPLRQVDL